MVEEDRVLVAKESQPVIYPLKRLLYSRKVLIAALSFIVTLAGEYGLPLEIVNNFNTMALAIIASWTAKDVATNLANGKNGK